MENDLYAIVFRILTYLYRCLKSGIEPDKSVLAAKGPLMDVSNGYHATIFGGLVDRGFVKGVEMGRVFGSDRVAVILDPRITMDGIEYLLEDPKMVKEGTYA